ARGSRGLTVQTFALYRMSSCSVRSSGNIGAGPSAPNPCRNSRREVVIFNVLAERLTHPTSKCSGAQYTTADPKYGREAALSSKKTVVETGGRKLTLSNLDKSLYPAAGLTKGQVIDYYVSAAPALLPNLRALQLRLK